MNRLFINRELSWLAFNKRVLEESLTSDMPPFERAKFISIFESNLDEFYMIRVGGLHDRSLLKNDVPDNKTGMSSRAQISAVLTATRPLYALAAHCYDEVSAALSAGGVRREDIRTLERADKAFLKSFFFRQLLPLLSPQIIDSRHPFPHLENKMLYVAAELCGEKESAKSKKTLFGLIPVSSVLPRVIFLPASKEGETRFVLCEDLLRHHLRHIFLAYKIRSSTVVRVTRNADIDVEDSFSDEDADYRDYMKEILKKRELLSPVRLEYLAGKNGRICTYLAEKLSLSAEDCFALKLPLDMSYVFGLEARFSEAQKESLLHRAMPPVWPRAIRTDVPIHVQAQKHDLFLFYPYDSMKPFLTLLAEAVDDPNVVSIKTTLYRLSHASQVIQYLCRAAENGKEVTALLELKARFDEENNIQLSQMLEEAGCRVTYGLEGYKVHSKTTLITRRTQAGIQLTCHIGTGNYNEKTARLYSDVSYITANPVICSEVVSFFHNMTTNNPRGEYRHLLVAPHGLKPRILALIAQQEERAKKGLPCEIKLKMNSLTDREIILALASASQAGVKIRMIVRGICCLRPGVPGLTENIEVRSIVGRYLEHARIFIFGVGKTRKVFISSADFMTRNTQRRVELASPILDPVLAEKLVQIVDMQLRDNQKSHLLLSDGSYQKVENEEPPLDSQMAFFDRGGTLYEDF